MTSLISLTGASDGLDASPPPRMDIVAPLRTYLLHPYAVPAACGAATVFALIALFNVVALGPFGMLFMAFLMVSAVVVAWGAFYLQYAEGQLDAGEHGAHDAAQAQASRGAHASPVAASTGGSVRVAAMEASEWVRQRVVAPLRERWEASRPQPVATSQPALPRPSLVDEPAAPLVHRSGRGEQGPVRVRVVDPAGHGPRVQARIAGGSTSSYAPRSTPAPAPAPVPHTAVSVSEPNVQLIRSMRRSARSVALEDLPEMTQTTENTQR